MNSGFPTRIDPPYLEISNLELSPMLALCLEREAIIEVLEEAKSNKTEAVRLLGIPYRSLSCRLKSLGPNDG